MGRGYDAVPVPMPPHLRRRAWILLWIAVAAFLVARATSRRESKGVILDHLEFGRRLVHGEDVYGPWYSDPDAPERPLHAPYPPSFGLLTAPFALVDELGGHRAARFAWALLQIAALAAAAWSLRTLLAPRPPPFGWQVLWLLTFVLGLRFLLRDMHGGGGNGINLGLCMLAFVAAERDRPRAAGLLLAFSLATKPTQLWLLPLFWLLDHRRALGWSLLGGLGFVAVTLALQRFDVAPWLRWLEGSWRLGTQADPFAVPALDFPPFEWMNQSLRCAIARWCGTVPDEYAAKVVWGVPPGLGLETTTVAWLVRASTLAILASLLWTAHAGRRSARARPWVFAAALLASVMLSPLSWKAHHMAILPALSLLVWRGALGDSRLRRNTYVLLALWAVCCLPGRDLVGDAADEWANSVYVVTIWDVVLFAWTLRVAGRTAREDDQAARSTA
ncbi:MAG: hypothetical protein RL398_940 [Planctomycetota bacterium]